jgi:MFS family permease
LSTQSIVMAVVAPISGTVSDRTGTRWPSVFGMLALALGLYLLSRLDAVSPVPQIALAMGVVGFGTGVFISPNNSSLMGAAPAHRQGIAAGILATARNTGMVLGIGISGAIFTSLLASQVDRSPESLIPAIQTSFTAIIIFALLGALTSAMRVEKSD